MEDRELLELAARAAGMDYLVWTPGTSPIVPAERRINGQMHWNPIHDDGDALRLAVKLNICLEFTHCEDDAPVIYCGRAEARRYWPMSEKFPDANAATRRAIVRAAAAIGKEM